MIEIDQHAFLTQSMKAFNEHIKTICSLVICLFTTRSEARANGASTCRYVADIFLTFFVRCSFNTFVWKERASERDLAAKKYCTKCLSE